jgi:vacuolar-type H+-ATPase subunit H
MAQQGSYGDPSIVDATRRINEIIDDADRQAGQIIMNAEVEARRYVQEVRKKTDQEAAEYARAMASLSEALISQAEALKRESERLLAGVGEYEGEYRADGHRSDAVYAEPGFGAQADGEIELRQSGNGVAHLEPVPTAETAVKLPPDPEGDLEQDYSAGARLLATQMAVAGSTRGDIRDRLVNDFGIADPEPLLDSILGAG